MTEQESAPPGRHGGTFDTAKLKRAIIENTGPGKKFTRRSLSLAASDGKNQDTVRHFLSRPATGRTSFTLVSGLVRALGHDLEEYMLDAPPKRFSPVFLKVIGAVEAGAWREAVEWPDDQQYEVRALQSDYPTMERFGLVVVGYSMDKLFAPGTILDCLKIPYAGDAPLQPRPGQLVIAQRHKGGLIETTCKRLGKDADGNWFLQPESTRPEHQEIIPIGKPDDDYSLDDGVTIVGIVTCSIMQHAV